MALPDIDLEKVYNIITNTEVLVILNKEGIFVHDIDFTQDFQGVINKQQVIKYLLQQESFRFEGDEIEYFSEDEIDYGDMINAEIYSEE